MLKPQTAQDLVVEALHSDIARGLIAPGSALRQEVLAQRFQVSRIPIREALRRLESEGIVTVIPNRGAYVIELSAEEIAEIVDLCILLEGDLIAHAVPRLSDIDMSHIAAAFLVEAYAASTPDWASADRAFHKSLYLPAGRLRQMNIAMSQRALLERYETLYRKLPQRKEIWTGDHRSIVEACQRRDAAEAKARLVDHLRRGGEFLIDAIGTASDSSPRS